MHDPLMQHLQFTADDLAANRAGQLSERQHAYLLLDRRKNTLLGTLLVALFVLATAVLLFAGIRAGNVILQVLGVVLMFCNMGVTYFFGVNWVRLTYDMKTGRADVIEGVAQHVVRQLGRAKAGSVRIGDIVEVPTDAEAFKAFEPGATYRLYRTTHTRRLLSIERV